MSKYFFLFFLLILPVANAISISPDVIYKDINDSVFYIDFRISDAEYFNLGFEDNDKYIPDLEVINKGRIIFIENQTWCGEERLKLLFWEEKNGSISTGVKIPVILTKECKKSEVKVGIAIILSIIVIGLGTYLLLRISKKKKKDEDEK